VTIDVFPYILPRRYFDRMIGVAPPGMALQKRMSGIPVLVDLDERFRIMDRYEGYRQVLTLANPPIEVVGGSDVTPDLARLAKSVDGMKRLASRLTWWPMVSAPQEYPRSTPPRGEASHGPYWHRRAQEGKPDLHPRGRGRASRRSSGSGPEHGS